MTEVAPPPVPWEAPAEPVGPAPGVEFAPHGSRIVAYLLDSVLLVVAMIALLALGLAAGIGDLQTAATGVDAGEEPSAAVVGLFVLLVLAMFVIVFAYFPFFWARGGQTPGMRPFGLVVVRDQDGGRIGWGTAWLRLIGMYVASSVFYLGFIWNFVDKRRRGWHDLIASTVVIKRS
jgi:uncharacterized RDD family membrane protein YckC